MGNAGQLTGCPDGKLPPVDLGPTNPSLVLTSLESHQLPLHALAGGELPIQWHPAPNGLRNCGGNHQARPEIIGYGREQTERANRGARCQTGLKLPLITGRADRPRS